MSVLPIPAAELNTLRSAVPYLRIPEDGEPYLEGLRCASCSAIFLDPRPACARCFARGMLAPLRLADHGRVYNFTVVHRNFPGVTVPFISVIVDLDGGGVVKGNLLDVAPDPRAISHGMAVRVVYRDAGRTDAAGRRYLAFFFIPDGSPAGASS